MLKGATTEGERAAAQAALDRMKPEKKQGSRPGPFPADPIDEAFMDAFVKAAQEAQRTRERGEAAARYRPPTGPEAHAAGRQARAADWWNDRARDELRLAQARETLRRHGFTMPGDSSFDIEFTYRAAGANATFNVSSEHLSRQAEYDLIRDMLSKMSTSELLEFAKTHLAKEE